MCPTLSLDDVESRREKLEIASCSAGNSVTASQCDSLIHGDCQTFTNRSLNFTHSLSRSWLWKESLGLSERRKRWWFDKRIVIVYISIFVFNFKNCVWYYVLPYIRMNSLMHTLQFFACFMNTHRFGWQNWIPALNARQWAFGFIFFRDVHCRITAVRLSHCPCTRSCVKCRHISRVSDKQK